MTKTAAEVDWIAVDWGTSRLRAWPVDAAGAAGAAAAGAGMDALEPDGFEPELLRVAAPWLAAGRATPVLVCGMAGARTGWREAPYLPVPAALDDLAGRLTRAPAADPRIAAWIVPGLAQEDPADADVLRGEETQLLGLARLRPGFAGLACLPGTHAKWALLEAGRVERFRTYLTGELFALMTEHSILRRSLAAEAPEAESGASQGFADGLDCGFGAPEQLARHLFAPRPGALLHGWSPGYARAWLSGALIGAEVRAALAHFGTPGGPVALIGAGPLLARYRTALQAWAIAVEAIDGAEAAIAGLTGLHHALVDDCGDAG